MSRVTLMSLLGLVAACKVGPDYEEPKPDLRPTYLEAGSEERTPRPDAWWDQLDDPTLRELIRAAVDANYDVRIAAAAYLAAAAILVVPTIAVAVPWLTELSRLFSPSQP